VKILQDHSQLEFNWLTWQSLASLSDAASVDQPRPFAILFDGYWKIQEIREWNR